MSEHFWLLLQDGLAYWAAVCVHHVRLLGQSYQLVLDQYHCIINKTNSLMQGLPATS